MLVKEDLLSVFLYFSNELMLTLVYITIFEQNKREKSLFKQPVFVREQLQ